MPPSRQHIACSQTYEKPAGVERSPPILPQKMDISCRMWPRAKRALVNFVLALIFCSFLFNADFRVKKDCSLPACPPPCPEKPSLTLRDISRINTSAVEDLFSFQSLSIFFFWTERSGLFLPASSHPDDTHRDTHVSTSYAISRAHSPCPDAGPRAFVEVDSRRRPASQPGCTGIS